MHALFCEPFNGEAFTVFLRTLLRRRSRGRRLIVISDNAAYHKSPPVRAFLSECQAVMRLLYLPSRDDGTSYLHAEATLRTDVEVGQCLPTAETRRRSTS